MQVEPSYLSHGLGGLSHGLGHPDVGAHGLGGVAGRRDLARGHVRPLLLLPQLHQLLRQDCARRLNGKKDEINFPPLWPDRS